MTSLSPEDHLYLGQLNAFRFLDEAKHDHVEQGPRRLVYHAIESNRLPECIAKRTAEWLLGRKVDVSEQAWLDSLGRHFVWSNLDFRYLVREIVTSPAYRSVQ